MKRLLVGSLLVGSALLVAGCGGETTIPTPVDVVNVGSSSVFIAGWGRFPFYLTDEAGTTVTIDTTGKVLCATCETDGDPLVSTQSSWSAS